MSTDLIEDLVNRLLTLDPEAAPKLRALEGKVLCFEVSGATRVCLVVTEGGLALTAEDRAPDVTLRGSLPAFARLVAGDGLAVFQERTIEIQGDVEVGRAFQKIVREFDMDLEEPLAKYVGDTAAYRVHAAVRQLRAWSLQAGANLAHDLAEALQEEHPVLARPVQVRRFVAEVDELRADVERLAQRIARLETEY